MFSNQRLLKSFGLLSIVFLAACVTPQQQTQASEYVEDSVITTKVKAAIFNEPTLKSDRDKRGNIQGCGATKRLC